jgi:hypothetical protein
MQTPQQFFKSRNIALLGQQHQQNFVLIDQTHHYKERGNVPECSNRILFIFSRHRPSNAKGWSRPGEFPSLESCLRAATGARTITWARVARRVLYERVVGHIGKLNTLAPIPDKDGFKYRYLLDHGTAFNHPLGYEQQRHDDEVQPGGPMTKLMAMWTKAIVGGLLPSRCRAVAAATLLGLTLCCAAWAQQPEPLVTQTPRVAQPQAVWTPMSGAPAGLLTALEGGRHDKFIERARAGNIDLVFFGATDTEMWSWPDSILGGVDRGKRVWDQAFGSLKAANFGSQGTHSESLLWRMQHGELDGYEAKFVVLHGVGIKSISGGQPIGNIGDQPIGDRQAEFVAGYARLLAEIRARQPQAKILILPPFPRGRLRREEWRAVADANAAAYRRLADASTVFYANFGDRFFLPDGSHNQEMWNLSGPVPNAGIHEPGFRVWAEELQPWIDRFVR